MYIFLLILFTFLLYSKDFPIPEIQKPNNKDEAWRLDPKQNKELDLT
jgi:hypothetical protein